MTFGYAYERYWYDDIAMNGYNYTQSSNFLSGAYANPGYNANIVYANIKYKL